MTAILVRLRLDVDAEQDNAEWWPEAIYELGSTPAHSKIADAGWDLVEAIHGGLPPAKRYRITVEEA